MGVSNTAGTLNFTNYMKKVQIGLSILMIIILSWTLLLTMHDDGNTSSPVEEMYHKQLVVTLDSILDARFNAGYCEEVIDSDDVSVTHNRFGRVLIPME